MRLEAFDRRLMAEYSQRAPSGDSKCERSGFLTAIYELSICR